MIDNHSRCEFLEVQTRHVTPLSLERRRVLSVAAVRSLTLSEIYYACKNQMFSA
nr:hypothetical protein JVH1_3295 [Rhodococcus sp. JVH1]